MSVYVCMWSSNPIISAKFRWIQTGFGKYSRLIISNWQFSTEPNRSTNKKTSEQIKIWKNRFLTIRWTKLNSSQKQQMHLLKLIKTRLFYIEYFFLWAIFNNVIAKKPLKSSKIVVFCYYFTGCDFTQKCLM